MKTLKNKLLQRREKMDSELEAIEVIKKYASINEKFVIQVKRNSDYNNDEFWKAVNFLLQESDFGFEII